jgi:hypothetical protein
MSLEAKLSMDKWMNMEKSDHQIRLGIIHAWATWIQDVTERQYRGGIWYASDVTLMFDHIRGNYQRKWMVMSDEADRVYSTLIRHVVHNPRSPSQAAKLPIWIVAPDYPTKKQQGMSHRAILAEVTINDGLHFSGIMLARIDTRLRVPLNMHFDPNGPHYQEYVHGGHPLRRIHVQPVRRTPDVMTDYTLKSLKWRIPDLDNVLIFPKTLSELPKLRSGGDLRP